VAGADYVLALVTPPTLEADKAERRPREMILVIDNSGSMSGTSMAQAKASLLYALTRLKTDDRFNIVRFNHTMDQLFPGAVTADAGNIARARAYVESLQAQGGTEMLPALEAALVDGAGPGGEGRHLRQVVFLTDGAIGNESQLLETIAARRGRSRIFTVGIGSAPNSYLMTRAAEIGRGTFTHIGQVSEVESRMRGLIEKLESPVVTGLAATFGDNEADATPSPLPDLYRGEPVVVAARLARAGGSMTLTGRIGEQPWQVTLPLAGAAPGSGLSKVWARRKIADAEVARTLRSLTPAEADKRILALALEHHLVSRLTSLVAVDSEISRKPGQRLTRADVPLNLPAGWDFDKVFGERAMPSDRLPKETRAEGRMQPTAAGGEAARAQDRAVLAGRTMKLAAARPIAQPTGQGVVLPKTATDAELKLLAGLGLLLAALALFAAGRRRERGQS
jgi:Ca-activated chloride channel family protein